MLNNNFMVMIGFMRHRQLTWTDKCFLLFFFVFSFKKGNFTFASDLPDISLISWMTVHFETSHDLIHVWRGNL